MNGKRARQQIETPLAALVYLARACEGLSLPIRIAEDWIFPTHLQEFTDEAEIRIRGLAALIEDYLKMHPKVLRQDEDEETAQILEVELADARKNLALVGRIGKAGVKTGADTGKSNSEIVREQIKRAITGQGSATDFSAEAEELRKLRAGELKIGTPRASKRVQP